jgi:hypothetical protein
LAAASSAISVGNFFEGLLGFRVGLRVRRPGLLPGQAEIVQQPQHAVLAVGDAEASLD